MRAAAEGTGGGRGGVGVEGWGRTTHVGGENRLLSDAPAAGFGGGLRLWAAAGGTHACRLHGVGMLARGGSRREV